MKTNNISFDSLPNFFVYSQQFVVPYKVSSQILIIKTSINLPLIASTSNCTC